MLSVALLDTSICTMNLGDEIIMDAVHREVRDARSDVFCYRVPTHERLALRSLRLLRRSKVAIVGGTNLLQSRMWLPHRLWKISLRDAAVARNLVLMGVGWRGYEGAPDLYTRRLLKTVLSSSLIHSVRDSYTLRKLGEAGIRNVANTSCVTVWRLTREHCAEIPKQRASSVVCCLTAGNARPESDAELLRVLGKAYRNIHFWPQSADDYPYLLKLREQARSDVEIVPPTLAAFDALLRSDIELDYVGTRLHAGIRAMQAKRRTLIVSIDNRATEMGRDINLPVVPRSDLQAIEARVRSSWSTELTLPQAAIDSWRNQLSRLD